MQGTPGAVDPATLTKTLHLFFDLNFEATDKNAFEDRLREELAAIGLTPEDIAQLAFDFKEGSVIANIHGPDEIIERLASLPLQDINIFGAAAQLAPIAEQPEASEIGDGDGDAEEAELKKLLNDSNIVTKVKEGESIKLKEWPTYGQLKLWRQHTRKEFRACSGLGRAAFLLIRRAERRTTTFEECGQIPDKFVSVVDKLNASMSRILKGEAGRKISNREEELAAKGIEMTGLQALYMLYRTFDMDEDRAQFYDITSLMKLECKNEADVERFSNTWDDVAGQTDESVSDASLA